MAAFLDHVGWVGPMRGLRAESEPRTTSDAASKQNGFTTSGCSPQQRHAVPNSATVSIRDGAGLASSQEQRRQRRAHPKTAARPPRNHWSGKQRIKLNLIPRPAASVAIYLEPRAEKLKRPAKTALCTQAKSAARCLLKKRAAKQPENQSA